MRKTPPKSPSRPNRRTMWPRAPESPLENALYVGIDVSQEHLDAAVVDARGNLLRAAQRYESTGPASRGSRRKFGSSYTPVNPGELTLLGEGEHLHEVRHRPVRPRELAHDPDLRPFRHQLADLKLLELP